MIFIDDCKGAFSMDQWRLSNRLHVLLICLCSCVENICWLKYPKIAKKSEYVIHRMFHNMTLRNLVACDLPEWIKRSVNAHE